jgi:hypothetical protein
VTLLAVFSFSIRAPCTYDARLHSLCPRQIQVCVGDLNLCFGVKCMLTGPFVFRCDTSAPRIATWIPVYSDGSLISCLYYLLNSVVLTVVPKSVVWIVSPLDCPRESSKHLVGNGEVSFYYVLYFNLYL